jgi:hypothetical protein
MKVREELAGRAGAWCVWLRRFGGPGRLAGRRRCGRGLDPFERAHSAGVAVPRMSFLHVTDHGLVKGGLWGL